MAKTIIAKARIENGKLIVLSRRAWDALVADTKNCTGTLTFEKDYATRSRAQNDYYHAVVVPRVAAAWHRDEKETHELIKAQFLPIETADGRNGRLLNGLVIGGSTTKLDTLEFIEYLERIVMFAAETLKVFIPDPDPLWRQHAEAARAKQLEEIVSEAIA